MRSTLSAPRPALLVATAAGELAVLATETSAPVLVRLAVPNGLDQPTGEAPSVGVGAWGRRQ